MVFAVALLSDRDAELQHSVSNYLLKSFVPLLFVKNVHSHIFFLHFFSYNATCNLALFHGDKKSILRVLHPSQLLMHFSYNSYYSGHNQLCLLGILPSKNECPSLC